MKNFSTRLMLTALLLPAALTAKTPLKLQKALIFQNGISALSSTIPTGSKKSVRVSGDAVPLLGSLWFTGPVNSVSKKTEKEKKKIFFPPQNISFNYSGKAVVLGIREKDGQLSNYSGTIVNPFPAYDPADEKADFPPVSETAVFLKRSDGRMMMFDRNAVVSLESSALPANAVYRINKVDKSCWEIALDRKVPAISAEYLSRGLKWNGSGKLTLLDNRQMALEFCCEVVNELADFQDVDIVVDSGNANFHYAGQTSPMALISRDFAAPSQSVRANSPYALQRASYSKARSMDTAFVATSGESEDINLFPLGKVSLKKGEVLYKKLIQGKAQYKRIAILNIAPAVNSSAWRQNRAQAQFMDALRFTNPLTVNIPEVPLLIVDGNTVLAQKPGKWLNRNEETIIETAPANTITVKNTEYDVPYTAASGLEKRFSRLNRNRQGAILGGVIGSTNYRLTDIAGTLKIKNHRSIPAAILVNVSFFGTPVSASDKPKQVKLDNKFSVNEYWKTTWELTLAPGEEKTLSYRYGVILH